MTVSVIIVSYNTRDLTLRCLNSLVRAGCSVDLEVVVIDNDSDDESAKAVREAFPEVDLVELHYNAGFAAACNMGAAQARGEYLLLLNPDTEIRPGCVEALIELAERRPEAGVVGGRTFDESGVLDPHSCWGLPSLWSMFCFASGLSTLLSHTRLFDPESLGRWPRDSERPVGVITGCLLLCRRDLWQRLNGMNERYFVYGEDVDFSFRARQLGFTPMISPNAELMHVRGAASSTSAAKWRMILRGKVTFMQICWSPLRGRLGVTLLLIGTALRAAAAKMKIPVEGPWEENWSQREAWVDGW